MAGLNAVMLANPITLIAAAVGALVAVLVVVTQHIEGIKNTIDELWERLQNNPVGQFISGLLTPLHASLAGILNIIDAFKNGGFLEGITAIGKAILGSILSPVQAVMNLIGSIPGIGKYVKNASSELDRWLYGNGSRANAPTVEAPVTQGDRMAYSREESVSDVNMNVSLAPGLKGTVNGKAPGVTVNTLSSGNFGK